jgi:hypothetical protein
VFEELVGFSDDVISCCLFVVGWLVIVVIIIIIIYFWFFCVFVVVVDDDDDDDIKRYTEHVNDVKKAYNEVKKGLEGEALSEVKTKFVGSTLNEWAMNIETCFQFMDKVCVVFIHMLDVCVCVFFDAR